MKRICFVCAVFVFLFCSCSTTLKMNVTRPAKLDLNGAKSIGVLPFSKSSRFPFYSSGLSIGSEFESYSKVSSVEQQVLNYIHSELEKGLMSSPYVSLINSSAVKNALRNHGKNPADVYISGEMVTFNVFDSEKIVKKEFNAEDEEKNNDKNVVSQDFLDGQAPIKPEFIYEKFYIREVLLVFNYQVVDGSNDNVLFFDTLKINHRSDPMESLKDLPDPYSMVLYDLQDFVSSFLQKLQPYNITRTITLLDDKTKNPQMERADKLAKDGYLKESYNTFYDVYKKCGLFEAGYNAAMILMVSGDLNGAEALMGDVYNNTGNIKASQALSDIMNEIRQNKILKNQIEKSRESDFSISEK